VVTDDSGSTTDTRTYNNLNQIETRTGGWTYSFDDNGCLLEKNNGTGVGDEKWEFSWNEDDRLTQVKKGVYAAGPVLVNQFTVDYTYDSAGRMLTRDDGTDVTTFVWDGWDLLSETTDSVTTDYLVPNGLIHSFLRDGELFVCHADALGSVRMVTGDAGDVVAQFEYGAWGELLDGSFDSVPGGMPFGFVGGLGVRTDELTGLMYMRARHYDSELARFISRDPLGITAGANLYAYCDNDPINWVDPSGLASKVVLHVRRGSAVDWEKLKKELECELGFPITVEFDLTDKPGFWDDTYHINVDFDYSLKVLRNEKKQILHGQTKDVLGRHDESVISIGGIIADLQTTKGWTSKSYEDQRKEVVNVLTNTVKHELGHALSGIGSEDIEIGRNSPVKGTVMSTKVLNNPDLMKTTLPYSPGRLNQIKRYVQTQSTF
jgi:RHS repeat-associated protein